MMIVHAAKPLFAWDCLEDSPSLQTIKDLLAALPDGKLLNSLRAARGKGRDDYPVSVLWGVVVLRVALRHITTEAVLAELRRNEGLRRVIGIESEKRVPEKWNMSRFEDVLGEEPHRTLLKEIFNVLIQRLGTAVADLGRDTAGDATDLSARRKPEKAAQEEIDEGLPQASGGRKEYKDDEGKVTKVVEWFGFKLHLVSSLTKLAMNSSCPYADGWPWTAWEVASCVGGDQSNSQSLDGMWMCYMPPPRAVPCPGSRYNVPRLCWPSLLGNGNVLLPPGSNVTKPRFGGPANVIARVAWRVCSPTAGKAMRVARSRFPPCNGPKSLNSPVWSRSPRGCTSRTGPAKTWPARRWTTRSSLRSARQRFAAFCRTSICNPIAPATGRRLASMPGSRRGRSKSFGAMGMRIDLPNRASGSCASMKSRPSRSWSVTQSAERSQGRSSNKSSTTPDMGP